ncbi:unnamed protein product, partial [Ectocarpus sp. 8 AP-2014]
MSAARVEQASAGDNSSGSRAAGHSLQALEEKARRLLKRCRYDDAAKTFRTLLEVAQVQRDAAAAAGRGRPQQQQQHSPYPKRSWSLEIGALESLAICLSRQLDDAGAEAAQRHALALRCREWEDRDGGVFAGGDRPGGDAGPGAGSDSGLLDPSSAVVAAKRAAVPCLRNLASFVSNQGRHVDAEVVLRTVLNILRDYKQHLSSQHHDGKGKREADAPPLDGGRGFGTDSASFTLSSVEEKRSDEAQADVGSPAPSPTPDTHNGGTSNGSPAAHPTTEPPLLSAVAKTGMAGGDESLGRDGSTANTTTGGDAYESGDPPAGSRPSAETAGGGGGGVGGDDLRSHAAQGTAALAEETVASAMAAATRAVVVMGETAATLEPSSLVVNHNRATRSDASPAPPPPSPVPLMKQASAGPTAGRRGGRLEESKLPGMKFAGGESGGDERGMEDVEGGEDEDPDQMAAVARHHLAVVIHAQ